MHSLKQIVLVAALGAAVSYPVVGLTQTAATKPVTAEMADAEVRKIDKDTGKITLKHSEIRNLDMPAMTMVFGVSDASLLDKVKAGDKIRFSAVNQGGKFTVTDIQPAK